MGAFFGGGCFLEDFLDFRDFGRAPGAKPPSQFESNSQTLTNFLQCSVFVVFLSAHFS